MTILQTIILGIIEGITEFIPISSTGHLILASKLLSLESSEFLKSFEIIIQLGAILAVILLYAKSLFDWNNIKKIIVGFIPTGIIGLLLYKVVKTYFLDNENIVLWSLFIGGLILIIFELINKRKVLLQNSTSDTNDTNNISTISYKQSFIIGLFQSISIIPGVSRSAATIIGGLSLGIDRQLIVKFSFLLAVPTMIVASGYDIIKNASAFSLDQFGTLAIGFVVSFAVAILAIKFFLKYISKHSFIGFGVYRIVLAIFLMLYF
jgi:undecaprenyl-diphosphatase